MGQSIGEEAHSNMLRMGEFAVTRKGPKPGDVGSFNSENVRYIFNRRWMDRYGSLFHRLEAPTDT